jgi:arsenite methyltransferase
MSSDLSEAVRQRYAAAATELAAQADAGCCGPVADAGSCCGGLVHVEGAGEVFGAGLYPGDQVDQGAAQAVSASLGCGVPTAVAQISPGDVVLDLGCGGGGDVLLSAARVGPSGRVYGLDMTDEMLALAQRHIADAGATNVVLLKGTIEQVPLPAGSVDVVISNCVINLAADKSNVFREAARVLRPGGRFAVSDVVADQGMDAATRADVEAWTGCIAGALTREEFTDGLAAAGFTAVEIDETHRVHEHAVAAIIRARLPG